MHITVNHLHRGKGLFFSCLVSTQTSTFMEVSKKDRQSISTLGVREGQIEHQSKE